MSDERMQPRPEDFGLLNPEVLFFDLEGLDDEQGFGIRTPVSPSRIEGLYLPNYVSSVAGFKIDSGFEWTVSPKNELVRSRKAYRRLQASVIFNLETLSQQPERLGARELQVDIKLRWNMLDLRYATDSYELMIAYRGSSTLIFYPNFQYSNLPGNSVAITKTLATGDEFRRGLVYVLPGGQQVDYLQSQGNETHSAPDEEKNAALAEFRFVSVIYNDVLQPIVGLLRERI